MTKGNPDPLEVWNNLPPVGDEARNFAFDISRYALAALKEADQ